MAASDAATAALTAWLTAAWQPSQACAADAPVVAIAPATLAAFETFLRTPAERLRFLVPTSAAADGAFALAVHRPPPAAAGDRGAVAVAVVKRAPVVTPAQPLAAQLVALLFGPHDTARDVFALIQCALGPEVARAADGVPDAAVQQALDRLYRHVAPDADGAAATPLVARAGVIDAMALLKPALAASGQLRSNSEVQRSARSVVAWFKRPESDEPADADAADPSERLAGLVEHLQFLWASSGYQPGAQAVFLRLLWQAAALLCHQLQSVLAARVGYLDDHCDVGLLDDAIQLVHSVEDAATRFGETPPGSSSPSSSTAEADEETYATWQATVLGMKHRAAALASLLRAHQQALAFAREHEIDPSSDAALRSLQGPLARVRLEAALAMPAHHFAALVQVAQHHLQPLEALIEPMLLSSYADAPMARLLAGLQAYPDLFQRPFVAQRIEAPMAEAMRAVMRDARALICDADPSPDAAARGHARPPRRGSRPRSARLAQHSPRLQAMTQVRMMQAHLAQLAVMARRDPALDAEMQQVQRDLEQHQQQLVQAWLDAVMALGLPPPSTSTSTTHHELDRLFAFDEAGFLRVYYDERWVALAHDLQQLAVLGIPVPNAIAQQSQQSAHLQRYGRMLRHVAQIYNTLGDRIWPFLRPLLVQDAVAFEQIVTTRRPEDAAARGSSSMDDVVRAMVSAAQQLESQNTALQQTHRHVVAQIEALLELDYVADMDAIKARIGAMKHHVNRFLAQTFAEPRAPAAAAVQTWLTQLDRHLLTVLRHTMRQAVLAVADRHAAACEVVLLVAPDTEDVVPQVVPSIDALRATLYDRIQHVLSLHTALPTFDAHAAAALLDAYLGAAQDANAPYVVAAYTRAHAALDDVAAALARLALLVMPSRAQVEQMAAASVTMATPDAVAAAIDALKEQGRKTERLPSVLAVRGLTLALAPFKRGRDDQLQVVLDVLINHIRRHVTTRLQTVQAFCEGAEQLSRMRPTDLASLRAAQALNQQLKGMQADHASVVKELSAWYRLYRTTAPAAELGDDARLVSEDVLSLAAIPALESRHEQAMVILEGFEMLLDEQKSGLADRTKQRQTELLARLQDLVEQMTREPPDWGTMDGLAGGGTAGTASNDHERIGERVRANLAQTRLERYTSLAEQYQQQYAEIVETCQAFYVPLLPELQTLSTAALQRAAQMRVEATWHTRFTAEVASLMTESLVVAKTKAAEIMKGLSAWQADLEREIQSLDPPAAMRTSGEGPTPASAQGASLRALLSQTLTIRAFLPVVLQQLAIENWASEHWSQFAQLTGIAITRLEDLTLARLVARKDAIVPQLEALRQMDQRAAGQVFIRRTLDELDLWSFQAVFEFIPGTATGPAACMLIKNWAALHQQIANHMSLVASLQDSSSSNGSSSNGKSSAPYADRIQLWETRLGQLEQVLQRLGHVQRQWIYLLPIFTRPGVAFDEQDRFLRTDAIVQSILKGIQRDGSRVTAVLDRSDTAAAALDRINHDLDLCHRALLAFLETKRHAFPRLFFMGDEDALELLGRGADPKMIGQHIQKLFAGVARVHFAETATEPSATAPERSITAMESNDGEVVPFETPVAVTAKPEQWLLQFEAAMRATLEHRLGRLTSGSATADLEAEPIQVVGLAGQIAFTRATEEAIARAALPTLVESYRQQLASLTQMRRRPGTSRLMQLKLRHQILDTIHYVRVLEQLQARGVARVSDWHWQTQMRAYAPSRRFGPGFEGCHVVQMADHVVRVGYEYQGIAAKLVHTPLTDRCYLTLTQAMAAGRGGNPFGPAGTGKTESVKALAAQLGRGCLVFNCDEGLDLKSMARILEGLARQGAWGCFDEFNRLSPGVLSGLSQLIAAIQSKQIAAIQQAPSAMPSSVLASSNTPALAGSDTPVHPDTGIFVTLNPPTEEYGGRQDLPENLKGLFRSVAMTLPDATLIAQTILLTDGFTHGHVLGTKMAHILSYCATGLQMRRSTPSASSTTTASASASGSAPSQVKYDFGLRALKVVVEAAGQLLESQATTVAKLDRDARLEAETQVVLQAFYTNTAPKLATADLPYVLSVIMDVFPALRPAQLQALGQVPEDDESRLARFARLASRVCATEALSAPADRGARDAADHVPTFLERLCQFYHACTARIGSVLVGPSRTGKTRLWTKFADVLEAMDADVHVHTFVVAPKALPREQLFGSLDLATREWTDGVLSHAARSAVRLSAEHPRDHILIVCDGDIDPEWIEALNSVLDDNRCLTLPNGERFSFTSHVHFIFETHSLRHASPATISRMGIIQLETPVAAADGLAHDLFQYGLTNVLETADTVSTLRGVVKHVYATCQPFMLPTWTPLDLWQTLLTAMRQRHAAKQPVSVLQILMLGLPPWIQHDRDIAVVMGHVRDAMGQHHLSTQLPSESDNDHEHASYRLDDAQPASLATSTLTSGQNRARALLTDAIAAGVPALLTLPSPAPLSRDAVTHGGGRATLTRHVAAALNADVCHIQCSAGMDVTQILSRIGMHVSPSQLRGRPCWAPKHGPRLVVYLAGIERLDRDVYGTTPVLQAVKQWLQQGGFDAPATAKTDVAFIAWSKVSFVASVGSRAEGLAESVQPYASLFTVIPVAPCSGDDLEGLLTAQMDHGLRRRHETALPPAVAARAVQAMCAVAALPGLPAPCVHLAYVMGWMQSVVDIATAPRQASEEAVVAATLSGLLAMALRLFGVTAALRAAVYEHITRAMGAAVPPLAAWGDRIALPELAAEVRRHVDAAAAAPPSLLLPAPRWTAPRYVATYASWIGHEDVAVLNTIDRFLAEAVHPLLYLRAAPSRLDAAHVAHAIEDAGYTVLAGSYGSSAALQPTVAQVTADIHAVFERVYLKPDADMGKKFVVLLSSLHLAVWAPCLNELLVNGYAYFLTGDEHATVSKALAAQQVETLRHFWFAAGARIRFVLVSTDANIHDHVQHAFATLWRTAAFMWRVPDVSPDEQLEVLEHRLVRHEGLAAADRAGIAQAITAFGAEARVPASALVLAVRCFNTLFSRQHRESQQQCGWYRQGLTKLAEAGTAIAQLKIEAAQQQQVLKEKEIEADAQLSAMSTAMVEAKQATTEMVALQGHLQRERDAASQQQQQIAAQLSGVAPLFEQAKGAVGDLKSESLTEIRSLRAPPAAVRDVLEAVLRLLGHTDTSWNAMKAFLGQRTVKESLLNFNLQGMSASRYRPAMALIERQPDSFEEDKIKRSSLAAAPLAMWAKAVCAYGSVLETTLPLQQALRAADTSLVRLQEEYDACELKRRQLDDHVAALKQRFGQLSVEAEQLKAQFAKATHAIATAETLVKQLDREKGRWQTHVATLTRDMSRLSMNSVVTACALVFMSHVDLAARAHHIRAWGDRVAHHDGSPYTPPADDLSVWAMVSDSEALLEWQTMGLANDALSMQNAVTIDFMVGQHGIAVPLVLDPSSNARTWLTHRYAASKTFKVVSLLASHVVAALEMAVRFGHQLLITDCDEIPAILHDVVLFLASSAHEVDPSSSSSTGSRLVKVGDKVLEAHPQLRLILLTRAASARIPAELSPAVQTIDFSMSLHGLSVQFLDSTLALKRPELNAQRAACMMQELAGARTLKQNEAEILNRLTAATSLLDDAELMRSLQETAHSSARVQQSLATSQQLQQQIAQERVTYAPFADLAARVYVGLQALRHLNPIYRFAFDRYLAALVAAVQSHVAVASDSPELVVKLLQQALIGTVLRHYRFTFFERDRTAAQLWILRIAYAWPDAVWHAVLAVRPVDAAALTALTHELALSPSDAATVAAAAASAASSSSSRASGGLERLQTDATPSTGLLCVRHLLPELFPTFAEQLVAQASRMGKPATAVQETAAAAQEATAAAPDLAALYALESPVLFLFTSGVDMTPDILQFAAAQQQRDGVALDVMALSGETDAALAAAVQTASQRDHAWLLIQNVQIAPQVVKLLQGLSGRPVPAKPRNGPADQDAAAADLDDTAAKPRPRFWLTADASAALPDALYELCHVVIVEAPQGLAANLRRTLSTWTPPPAAAGNARLAAQAAFVVAWFHAVVQERRQYQPQGWTQWYEFGAADVAALAAAVTAFLQRRAASPADPRGADGWAPVQGLVCEAYYGAKVADPIDHRILQAVAAALFHAALLPLDGRAPTKRLPGGHALPTPTGDDGSAATATAWHAAVARLDPANGGDRSFLETALLKSLMLPENMGRVRMMGLTTRVVEQLSRLTAIHEHPAAPASSGSITAAAAAKKEGHVQRLRREWDATVQRIAPALQTGIDQRPAPSHDVLAQFWRDEAEFAVALLRLVQVTLAHAAETLAAADAADAVATALQRGTTPLAWRSVWPGALSLQRYLADVTTLATGLAARLAEASPRASSIASMRPYTPGTDVFRPALYLTSLRQAAARRCDVSVDALALTVFDDGDAAPAGDLAATWLNVHLQGATYAQGVLAPVSRSDPSTATLASLRVGYRLVGADASGSAADGTADGRVRVPVYADSTRRQLVAELPLVSRPGEETDWALFNVALMLRHES